MKAPILLALAALSTAQAAAQAAEPTGTLTLACEGKVTQPPDPQPVPVSFGIIINFTAGTVTWPDYSDYFPLPIISLTEMTVKFGGSNYVGSRTVFGSIDRVTGNVDASLTEMVDPKTRRINFTNDYSLKCKPTQRMF